MIFLYRFLFFPLFIILLPAYLRRMLRRGGYAQGFTQRLGWLPTLSPKQLQKPRIWIQAVSVGEIQSIGPLLEGFIAAEFEVILTTTTSTGYQLARQHYAHRLLHVGLFPIDFWPCSALAWSRINPDRVLHIDSELWPEHLHQARLRKIPVDLCNARLSDRSFRRYKLLKPFAAYLLDQVRLLLAATPLDAERFIALGARRQSTLSIGNLKLDQPLTPKLEAQNKLALLNSIGFQDALDQESLILLGSSTWSGEESLLLDVLRIALSDGLATRLILVPRHPERRSELKSLLVASGFRYHIRSEGLSAPANTQVYLVDTMGELNLFTALATVAFIGKSLPPHLGGQSPVAAAGLGIPMVMGPEMSNFRALAQSLLAHQGAVQVSDSYAAQKALIQLLKDAPARQRLHENAQAWFNANQGATQRALDLLI